jgi:hypothetical protein
MTNVSSGKVQVQIKSEEIRHESMVAQSIR